MSSCFTGKSVYIPKFDPLFLNAGNFMSVEYDYADSINYFVKNDGTIVQFKQLTSNKPDALFSPHLAFDNVKIPLKEIKGYLLYRRFFIRKGHKFFPRVVHGKKLNVYQEVIDGSSSSMTATGSTVNSPGFNITKYKYWIQEGEAGKLEVIDDTGDIKKKMIDCPTTYAMLDKISKETRKKILKTDYLYRVFMIYKNDCKL